MNEQLNAENYLRIRHTEWMPDGESGPGVAADIRRVARDGNITPLTVQRCYTADGARTGDGGRTACRRTPAAWSVAVHPPRGVLPHICPAEFQRTPAPRSV
jgi:hypothetical protein